MTRLTDRELELVRRNRPIYEEAERLTGAPWRMLAAIHYLESSLSTVSPGPGGAFQMDPPPDDAHLARVLGRYGLPVQHVEDDFLTAAVVAADHLQQKVLYRLHADTTDEALIKDAFWGYNGRAYGSADDSPYVSNDPPVRILNVHGTYLDAQGVRRAVNGPFAKHGAIFVYRELLEVFPPDETQHPVIVVDDDDPEWQTWYRDHTRDFIQYQDPRGRDFKYAKSSAAGDTFLADWRPALPRRAQYRVDVYVPGVHGTTRQALYFVKGVVVNGGLAECPATVDQLSVSDSWITLGEFVFDPAEADSGVVRLTNYSPEVPETDIAFDSVRWTHIADA